jgi:hypothetical protein
VDARIGVGGVFVRPEIGLSGCTQGGLAFDGSSDFVFAYRLREIFYKRGALRRRDYNRGTVLGERNVVVENGDGPDADVYVGSAELADEDALFGGQVCTFSDNDGEECDIVI